LLLVVVLNTDSAQLQEQTAMLMAMYMGIDGELPPPDVIPLPSSWETLATTITPSTGASVGERKQCSGPSNETSVITSNLPRLLDRLPFTNLRSYLPITLSLRFHTSPTTSSSASVTPSTPASPAF
jgi:hypothetical protein